MANFSKNRFIIILSFITLVLLVGSLDLSGIQSQIEPIRIKVNSLFIPQTVDELSRMSNMEAELKNWQGSNADRCILEWAYSEDQYRLVHKNWIFLVEKPGKVVGLIATDPDTGEFCWRTTWDIPRHIKRINAIFLTEPQMIKEAVLSTEEFNSRSIRKYTFNETKLVSIEGNHYWIVPDDRNNLDEHLAIPINNLTQVKYFSEIRKNITDKRAMFADAAANVHSDLSGKKFKPPPKYLEKHKDSASILSENISMVGEVPIYYQGDTWSCWAYSLAMIHQWWSPINLGTGDQQAELIRTYLDKTTTDFAFLQDCFSVMDNWASVGSNYENYVTTGYGSGEKITVGEPTWILNDIKTWIAIESPVLVLIDSDGGGGWTVPADHYVVITGYDDTNNIVYANNPWGITDSWGYTSFNDDYWSATWWPYEQRGMCGGYPGDDNYTAISSTSINFPDTEMYDNEKVIVADIGMTITNDDAGGGWDSFYDTDYYNYFTAYMGYTLSDYLFYYGETTDPVSNGTWWSHTPVPPDKRITFQKQSLSPGQSVQNASFHIKVDPDIFFDKIRVSYGWVAWDQDNRSHSDHIKITVSCSNQWGDGTRPMKKPIRDIVRASSYQDIQVYDDDEIPPQILDFTTSPDSPVPDNHDYGILLLVNVTDASGIGYVKFRYRYGNGPWHETYAMINLFNTYGGGISYPEWTLHKGETIYWVVEAGDADNDRNGDQSIAVSPQQTLEISEAVYNWTPPKRLTWMFGSSVSPDMALDSSQNIHLVWQDEKTGNNEIYYKKSTNGGDNWTSNKRITYTSGSSEDPAIAVSSGNDLHVTWFDSTPGNAEIYYKKSTNDGVNWTPVKRLSWNSGDSKNPQIALSPGNTVYIVWRDRTPGNDEIYFRKSIDNGNTWSALKRLTWTSGHSYHPGVKVGSNGHIHIGWDDITSGNAEIYYKKSTDSGSSFPGWKRLTYNSGNSWFRDILLESDSLIHVFWDDLTPGNPEIHHKKSLNGGTTWESPHRITWNSGDSWAASAGMDSANFFHIVWNDSTPGNSEIYYRYSPDQGGIWAGSKRLTWNSGSSQGQKIVINSSDFIHLVWQDNTPGNYEIYFKSRK